MQPNANAQQINEFFGIQGNQSLYGGSRGRMFLIQGVFLAQAIGLVFLSEQLLLSYADGFSHTLVDNFGNVYQNVVFDADYQRTGIPRPAAGGIGYAMPYRAAMRGLT